MSALTEFKIKSLQDFRAGILDLKKEDLTPQVLMSYFETNVAKVKPLGASLLNPLGQFLSSIVGADDVTVLDSARDEAVRMVDSAILQISGEPVRPILADLILKVKDTKLSTLLKEFNAIKDQQPNFAAIGLRTIICLIILEKAKLASPQGELANTTDLMLKPMLRSAIKDEIFGEGETKLLKAFEQQGLKETFDNVVHKPGDAALIKTDDLSSLVQNTVNKLLAAIV
jgi:hypothetical protein